MYFRPSTNEVFALHGEIRAALWESAGIILGATITDADLADAEVYPLVSVLPETQPGEVAVPGAVELVDGEWMQLWTVRDMTPEELEESKPSVPQVITIGQGKEALYNAGLFSSVQSAIDAIEDADTKWRIQNAWDNRPSWERQSPFVLMMAGVLGLDSQQADQLFIDAAKL